MKIKILALLVLFSSMVFSSQKDFDQLTKLFRQQCRLANLPVKNNITFEYNDRRSMLENMDKYAEIALKYHLKNREVTWLKSGLIYNTYTRWPKSGFWKSIGYGYQAVKINHQQGLFPKVGEILTQKVSPKNEALYFLHGQYASLLIKVINGLKDVSIESCNHFINQSFAKDWFEAISLVYPQKEVGVSNLDEWFQEQALANASSPMAEMPVSYVAEKFEALYKVKWTTIISKEKKTSKVISINEAQKRFNKKVLQAVAKVYYTKALELWMDSPVVVRPQIELVLKAFVSMQKGKNRRALELMAEARQNFALRCKWAVSISEWLDHAETGIIPFKERFKDYLKVFKTTPPTKYSQYLDQVEQQLEDLKE